MAVKIMCVVENTVKLSSNFWGEHGMAVLVEDGDSVTLFDSGQSGRVLLHNLEKMHLDPQRINQVVLSHGHYDHTGGLKALFDVIGARPVYGHPDIFNRRFSEGENGSLKSVDFPVAKTEFAGVDWHLSAEPMQISSHVFTTGEIARLEPLEEQGDERLKVCCDQDCHGLTQDPLKDDMSLVIQTEQGLVVLLGCCHAGVMNTLNQIQRNFPNEKVYAMMGGTHLAKASEARLIATEQKIQNIAKIGFSHCTGIPVTARFLNRFPQQAFVFQVGSVLTF